MSKKTLRPTTAMRQVTPPLGKHVSVCGTIGFNAITENGLHYVRGKGKLVDLKSIWLANAVFRYHSADTPYPFQHTWMGPHAWVEGVVVEPPLKTSLSSGIVHYSPSKHSEFHNRETGEGLIGVELLHLYASRGQQIMTAYGEMRPSGLGA